MPPKAIWRRSDQTSIGPRIRNSISDRKRRPEITPRGSTSPTRLLPFLYSCDPELRQTFAAGLHAPRNRLHWVVEHERSADMKRDRITKKRNQLARSCERAAVPERPFLHGPRYLVHPDVTAACAPSLRVIAGALR